MSADWVSGELFSDAESNTESDTLLTQHMPGDSVVWESAGAAPDGHLMCLIRKTVNCNTRTVTLQAFTQALIGGGNIVPVSPLWSNGQTGHSITVVPPGTWNWVIPPSITCDHFNNTITINESFFQGPLTIQGPNVICPGESGTLTVPNLNGYNFNSWTWTPQNPLNTITPYPVQNAGAYVLNVIDQFECPHTAVKTVQISPPVNPLVSGTVFMCSTGSQGTLTVNPAFSQYYWQNGFTGRTLTIFSPGSYVVTVTNQFGCTADASWTVNPADIDTILGTVSVPAICPGTPSTIQIVGGPYPIIQWSNGAIGNSNTVTQPGTYSVTVTNPFGCSAARQFTILPAPQPTPVLNSPAICPGASATLSVSGGNFSAYHWSNGQKTPTISVNTPGTYSVTVSDAAGCTGTATTFVQASPAAVPTITGQDVICAPATITLQASGGFATYQWTTPGGTISGQSITAGQSGTYTVLVSNSAGCTGTASLPVTIHPQPSPTVTVATYQCNGQFNLSAGSGFAQYVWSNGATTPDIVVQSSGNYVLTVTSTTGCTGTTAQQVTLPPAPATSILGVSSLCPGVTGQLTATGNYTQYQWSGGGTGQTITASMPGTYGVTVTDAYGCTATAERTVHPSPPLSPVISGPLRICVGSSGTLMVLGNYSTYLWSNGATTPSISVSQQNNYTVTVTDGGGCSGSTTHLLEVGTGLAPQITAAPYQCNGQINLSAGQGFSNYTWSNAANTSDIVVTTSGMYSVTVTDATGCSGTSSLQVNIPPPPGVAITGNTDVCAHENTQLSATPGYVGYSWSSGQNTPNITVSSGGQYSVTVSDAFGCTATASVGVQVFPPILPDITGPSVICQNESATLGVNIPFSQYLWSNGANSSTIVVNQNGTYRVTVTDAKGCTAVAEQSLLVNAAPQPILQQSIYDCDGTIDLSVNAQFSAYLWSTGSSTTLAVATSSGNYIITVTDGIGCTGTGSIMVVIPDAPLVSIPPIQPFCQGNVGQLQASGNFNNYIWSGGQTTTGITVTAAGNYSVTVTDEFGCTASASTQVSVLPLPSPKVQGPPEMCAGANFSLTVSGGNFTHYVWSNGATSASTTISFPGQYTVTVTDTNGCKNASSITVDVGTPPIANAGTDQTLTCVETAVALDGSNSSSGQNIHYQWIAPNGLPMSGGNQPVVVVSSQGIYRLIVTNTGNGCSASDQVTVSQSADVPVVAIDAPQVLNCINPSVSLNATGSASGSNIVYQWTTSSGNIVSGATGLQPTIDAPGIYTLRVINTDNNCSASASVEVTRNTQPPIVQVGPQETLTCTQTTLNILAQVVSSFSQNLSYQWTTLDGRIIAHPNSPAPIVGAPGVYTVLVIDLLNGCSATAHKSIVADVNLPVANIAPPDTLTCRVGQITLNATASSVGANFKYNWTASNGGQIISQSQPLLPVVGRAGTYTLIITNITNGCADTMQVQVVQNIQKPTAHAGQPGTLTCAVTTIQLSGSASSTSPNGVSVLWDTNDGLILTGVVTLQPTVGAPGTYTLLVTDRANGCTQTASVTISENTTPPQVSIATPEILTCIRKIVPLNAQVQGHGNNPIFRWTTIAGNFTTPTDQLSAAVDQPGTYILQVTNQENGCSRIVQTSVLQNIAPPPVSVEDPPLLTCSRTTVRLKANFSNVLLAEWTTTDGIILGGANSALPTVGKAGLYTVLVTNPTDGCTNSVQVLVREETNRPNGLTFQLTPPDCTGKKGKVEIDQVFGGVPPLLYSINGGKTFFSSQQFGGIAPGNYQLTVQDANGCEHSMPLSVPVPLQPAVSITPVFEIQFGDNLRLDAQLPAGIPASMIQKVIWKPLDHLTFEDTSLAARLRPWVKPFSTTHYTVTVVTPEGCEASARVQVKVIPPEIFVPNVIRPTGTQHNDNQGFTIFASEKAVQRIQRLQIYDRWGEHVFVNYDFAPNDPSLGWNGTFRDKDNTPAVFVWYAEVLMRDGSVVFLKGDVTVLR